MVASKLGFRILVGIQDAVFKRDMKHCIRGRQAPAIKKKIPWYALRQHRNFKKLHFLDLKISSGKLRKKSDFRTREIERNRKIPYRYNI